jgi:hypothetical protein
MPNTNKSISEIVAEIAEAIKPLGYQMTAFDSNHEIFPTDRNREITIRFSFSSDETQG